MATILTFLRHLLSAMLIAAVGISSLGAQVDTLQSVVQPPYWTIDLSVRSNFTVGPFLGNLLSVSKVRDPGSRWRFGIGASYSPSNGDETEDRFISDSLTIKRTRTFTGGSLSVAMVAQTIYTAPARFATRWYVGWGPILNGFYHVWDEEGTSTNVSGYGGRDRSERRESTLAAGIIGSFGVEWEFTSGMSIHAEYGAVADYQFTKRTDSNISSWSFQPPYKEDQTYTSKGLRFQSLGVLFGLSLAI